MHVVGLVARRREDRHAQRLARLVHPVDLLGQVVGHRRAVGLVVGDDLVAERRAGQVERRGDVGRLVVGDQLAQHRHEDVDRVRGLALPGSTGRGRGTRGRRGTSASCRRSGTASDEPFDQR